MLRTLSASKFLSLTRPKMGQLRSISLTLRLRQEDPIALASLAALLVAVTGRRPAVLRRWNKRYRKRVVAGGCVRLIGPKCWHFIEALKYTVLLEGADIRGLQVSAVSNRTINLNLKPLLSFCGTQRAANLGLARLMELDAVPCAQVSFASPRVGSFILGACMLPVWD